MLNVRERALYSIKHDKEIILLSPEGALPFYTLEAYNDFCGIDKFGLSAVPDCIFGVNISAACAVHDYEWSEQNKVYTWDYFHASNSRFLHNLLSIIDTCSTNIFTRWLRRRSALIYYIAVDKTAGPLVYWAGHKLKKEQFNV